MENDVNIEIKMPKCIENRYSLKSITLHELNALIQLLKEKDSDCQALLLTPFGFIKGDIDKMATPDNFTEANQAKTGYSIDYSIVYNFRNEDLLDIEKESENIHLVDNGAFLNMKNVSIIKEDFQRPIATFSQMLVFVDQVISFSIIPRDVQS